MTKKSFDGYGQLLKNWVAFSQKHLYSCPERPELIKDILKEVPEFNYRLAVKAGLTGYAQVYGKYNTKTKDKLLFDLIYIENYSFFLDIRIMFMTFKILFMKESTEGVEDEAHE